VLRFQLLLVLEGLGLPQMLPLEVLELIQLDWDLRHLAAAVAVLILPEQRVLL
jgi:hypothetical protein